jgi:hypothetical protein
MTTYSLYSQVVPSGATLSGGDGPFVVGVQFSVSQPSMTCDGIWFYSGAVNSTLPGTIGLYTTAGSLVTSNTATWLTVPGGSAAGTGSGWMFAAFTSPPTLTSGTAYTAAATVPNGPDAYSFVHNYFSTGPGGSGIANGPLSAPNDANATHGQNPFTSGTSLAFPSGSFQANSYFVDVQVSTNGTSHSGSFNLVLPKLAVSLNGTVTHNGQSHGLLMSLVG